MYLYEFTIRPVISKKPDYIIADHGDDIFYSFGMSNLEAFDGVPFDIDPDTDRDTAENMMMQYWASFAKTG